jgi:hypothetical protein
VLTFVWWFPGLAGGFVEFSVKLPGNKDQSGFWAATWLMGNLGRAGYYPSLEGMWPFSYDSCERGDQAHSWNDNKTQRISRCSGKQGNQPPYVRYTSSIEDADVAPGASCCFGNSLIPMQQPATQHPA